MIGAPAMATGRDEALATLEPPGGWVRLRTPRIEPARGTAFRRLVDLGCRAIGRPEPANILLTMQRSPRHFWSWLAFAAQLMPFGSIDAADRERVILRVAWNCRCRYEFHQHLDLARRAGLTAAEIARVTEGPDAAPTAWGRALLSACDELHRARAISDATWQVLAERYPPSRLVELTLLIGHYEMVAGFLNSAGVELERIGSVAPGSPTV